MVRYASAVHSVDRKSLVSALDKAMAAEQQRRRDAGCALRGPLRCFVQIDLEDTGSGGHRGGAGPQEVPELAARIDAADQLELAGVMAVAPLGADPDQAFAALANISARLRLTYPGAEAISAGMSSDLEHALRHGATHLRVGSDVLGERPGLR